MNKLYFHITSILIFISSILGFSQQKLNFEKINNDKNQIQSIVYSICADKYNNMWFATEEGIVRYNSSETYNYNTFKGIPSKIGNRIFQIILDNDKTIWAASKNGIIKYNEAKNIFEEVYTISNLNKINSFCIDINKNLWIATEKGIIKIDKDLNKSSLFSNIFITKIVAIQNQVIFSSANESYFFQINSNNLNKLKFNNNEQISFSTIKYFNNQFLIGTKNGELYSSINLSIPFNKIIHLNKSKNSTIRDIEFINNEYFLAVDGEGVFVLDKNLQIQTKYNNNDDNPNSISSNGVYDIYLSKDNIIWFATYGGGVNYSIKNKDNFQIYKHQINSSNSIKNNITRAILEDNDNIIFGTKKGISILNKTTKNWKHITNFPFIPLYNDAVVLSLVKYNNQIIAGTYNNGLYTINTNSGTATKLNIPNLEIEKIYKLFVDSQNNLWVGGIDGKLSVIKNNIKYKDFEIKNTRDINEFKNNIICVGIDGVYSISLSNFSYSKIKELNSIKGKFEYNTINNIVTTKNQLVLGSNGMGLIFYNWNTKKIKTLTTKNNLPSNVVQGIIKLNDTNFWVSTTNGIANITFKPKDTLIKNYTKTDGLSSTEYNYGSFYKLKNNQLLFGGIEGVTSFNPSSIKPRNIKPKLFFEELYIDNQAVSNTTDFEQHINSCNDIELKSNQNSFGIKFIGILQGYSSKVKYRWKLEGFDENWSEDSFNNQINYTNLSSGNYTLTIQASDELGNFVTERKLNIHINAPWYASFWAFLFYLLLIGALLYAIIYITKIIEIKKSKEEQLSFFNNITHEIKTPLAILLSSLENENSESKTRVKHTIERINALIDQMLNFQRYSLTENTPTEIHKIHIKSFTNQLVSDFKPLLEQKKLTIELIDNYKKQVLYFDDELLNKILFNLISNAIKYSFDNNKIIITINETIDNKIEFKVQDFGIGIPKIDQGNILTKFFRAKNVMNNQFSGTGLGLMIVKNIVEKTKGQIFFESIEEKGTTFTVILPSFDELYSEKSIVHDSLKLEDLNEEIEKFTSNKILIIEDNKELRENLVKILENYFLVFEAENGKEGLEKALDVFPDLIITDYLMPELDGIEMCKLIKNDINLNHIPVFMMTALYNSLHKKESIDIGVSEYIEKPINVRLLLAKITNTFIWQEKLRERYMHINEVDTAGKFKHQKENEFLDKLETIILDKVKDEDFSLQEICNIVGMSRTSLYMKLKNLIDLSPQDFIIHTKLKYAKKLLIEGDINIKEVAYASGFSNPKYFSTSFKKAFGTTPSNFIKNLEKGENPNFKHNTEEDI